MTNLKNFDEPDGRKVRSTRLESGLTILTEEMPGRGSIALGVWVGAGGRFERSEACGAAHLLEHMLFKGTEHRTAEEISLAIETVGGSMNAYTGREATAFYARLLKEDTELGLDVIADMLTHSVFRNQDYECERQVILQEVGMYLDQPDAAVFDNFQAAAFPDLPLGRPILGEAGLIDKMPKADMIRYFEDCYVTGRTVVAATGAVHHEHFVALVAEKMQNFKVGFPEAATLCHYVGGESREARDLEQTQLVLGFQGFSLYDPLFHAGSMMTTILGGSMSSRLFQEVREKRGLAYSIGAGNSAWSDVGVVSISAGTAPGDVGELINVTCDEVCKIAEDVREDELERVRTIVRASTIMESESAMARVDHTAHNQLIFGRPISDAETLEKIEAVTLEDVRCAARHLLKAPITVAGLGPIEALASRDKIAARLGAPPK